jgi:hypothetical protein
MQRGSYGFEVLPSGNLTDNTDNLERARALFCDGAIISQKWGPGEPGDFDNGGWHSLCHLAAAAGVFKSDSTFMWVGITHAGSVDRYLATVSFLESSNNAKAVELRSAEGRSFLANVTLEADFRIFGI